MAKCVNHEKLTATIEISECNDGWWLWDKTRGMNLKGCARKHVMMLSLALWNITRNALQKLKQLIESYKVRLRVSFLSL